MSHAWLDSLSEDWVSQPPSEEPSMAQIQPIKSADSENRKSTHLKGLGSRIPRPIDATTSSAIGANDDSFNVLAERSLSYINITAPRNGVSTHHSAKSPGSQRDRYTSRTVSGATNNSVIHNTVQHRSTSGSPGKSKGHTPEWRKRLVYGELAYGEQRDLFCSAAAGLEDIFKPPPVQNMTETTEDPFVEDDSVRNETTLPSSPPVFRPPPALEDSVVSEDAHDIRHTDVTPSPSPRKGLKDIRYRIVDESAHFQSDNDFSIHQDATFERGSRQSSTHEQSEHKLQAPHGESRKPSSQSVVQNEDFSPIFLSKHSSGDGQVDFAPMDLPADQLRSKLENLRLNQMLIDSVTEDSIALDGPPQRFKESLVDTTEDYVRNGGFLNLQRGGRSAEGSFRHRLLSPVGNESSEMLPEESLQASTPKQFPSVKTMPSTHQVSFDMSPRVPRAPHPSPDKRANQSQASGGSPLKLFGPYDTFTNQTLMRRISQFEEQMSNSSRQTFQADPFEASTKESQIEHSSAQERQQKQRSVSRFGAGDLEGYQFQSDLSGFSEGDGDLVDEGSGHDISRQENTHPEEIERAVDSSPPDGSQLFVRRRRRKSAASESDFQGATLGSRNVSGNSNRFLNTPKRDGGSEGKRPRTSPSKNPTPKRRRTLHESDIAYGREEDPLNVDAVQSTHQQMQAAIGKKRKDNRAEDRQKLADPELLAHRQILRPRTPTPSQRSSIQREKPPVADGLPSQGKKLKRSPIRNGQSSAASQSMLPGESERKPSIKTQDFLDEAAQIMAMIRNQVRPTTLASVQESEAENASPEGDHYGDDTWQESTREPFSRPPSRDGGPVARAVPARQEDPEILNRLKKYQELSDMGEVITSSIRSMGLAREAIRAAHEVERQLRLSARGRPNLADMAEDEEFSDPPNIRITHGHVESGNHNHTGVTFPSMSSNSTNRSYPTNSSRTSENKKTIAPQSVSHLIPDQVGSMYLDKENKVWIRKKSGVNVPTNVLPSEDSEDDPFASIPDLTVDMTLELRNLKLATEKKEQVHVNPEDTPSPSSPLKTPAERKGFITLSPDAALDEDAVSRARNELTKLESRAAGFPGNGEEDVEHEITINEGRNAGRTPSKRRNLTISFSSPVASIIRDVLPEDLNDMSEVESPTDASVNQEYSPDREPVGGARKPSMSSNYRKGPRGLRQSSFAKMTFVPRPVSRIDEQEEDSALVSLSQGRQVSIVGENSAIEHFTPPNNRRTSVSFIIKSARGTAEGDADASAIIGQNVGNLSLSPLSEFTMNHADQSYGLEVSYVLGDKHLVSGDGSKRVMSISIRDLVDRLTEVEPSEPFWDSLVSLDLHEKRLSSLHMLDEFCGRLVSLDASNNALGHLDGVPSTIRQLRVSHNMLSELTSWDHLANLQYLDISNNDVRSLSALKNLVHLRSIKADNNLLTSLDGINELDGLLTLRARNNRIEELDFEGCGLERLAELDLAGNHIKAVKNIEKLSALTTLKLQRNQLESFRCESKAQSLRYLDVGDNKLQTLDLAGLPKLRLLHADRNQISRIAGFSHARYLDSLSLREQKGDEPLDVSFLSSAYEVRKLFLSGNYIKRFEPQVDFLNLQFLELANCGLQSLPPNLGQLMPNLRTLNINFNAISDLSPLRFVPRMKKLLAAGNRLADTTAVTELLTDFPHLTRLDLRDNPITLGFYPPLQVLVHADGNSGSADGFALPEADTERDEKFASRLDGATRLRRRLYEVVFVGCCGRLKVLDGLVVKRNVILARDETFEALIKEGLLPDDLEEEGVVKEERKRDGDTVTSRWWAEDSFA
ncbi:hypothetical protein jhhlp_008076 [Lomentospora prolificans]|uniref:Septation initiation network scaffold protein cdc11 n=1 Tax=Lomentospora prolificans TaxID=41688 RepID=A0A2N3MZG1_9PEZI|nr:hypothetical protein jhhlp_008076 [Lomentospora prolificans]